MLSKQGRTPGRKPPCSILSTQLQKKKKEKRKISKTYQMLQKFTFVRRLGQMLDILLV